MKCKVPFSGKNKKNITNSSSAELAQRVVKVKATLSSLVNISNHNMAKVKEHVEVDLGQGYTCFQSNSFCSFYNQNKK